MKFKISKMLQADVYEHPVGDLELIETHISWVVLTGDFVYKIKKPVDLGFLDFSTLAKRKEFCEQEYQLNRRLAPDIYLGVVSIVGTMDKPVICVDIDDANAFEFAVKMKQFPQSAQLDNRLAAGKLTVLHIDALAEMVANFHKDATVANKHLRFGEKDRIYQLAAENFDAIDESLDTVLNKTSLDKLKQWSQTEFSKLQEEFESRRRDGFIRECHGDMHLRNLAWIEGKPLAFDCIEFSEELRWIDVMAEIAFLIMDLQDRNQQALANRFLNKYMELSGDYAGLRVLPFYLCYRAMVRAKVDALRIGQLESNAAMLQHEYDEFESYLQLATSYTTTSTPSLIIMRGLSASGKSTVSQQLLEKNGAIRIRSDVERKRLFAQDLSGETASDIDQGIYTSQASEMTYERLLKLASEIIKAGYSVIIDAAFLQYQRRKPFQNLAKNLGVPYIIMEVTAPYDVLRRRILARKNDVSDADLNVLNNQIKHFTPLTEDEKINVLTINTDQSLEIETIVFSLNNKVLGG